MAVDTVRPKAQPRTETQERPKAPPPRERPVESRRDDAARVRISATNRPEPQVEKREEQEAASEDIAVA